MRSSPAAGAAAQLRPRDDSAARVQDGRIRAHSPRRPRPQRSPRVPSDLVAAARLEIITSIPSSRVAPRRVGRGGSLFDCATAATRQVVGINSTTKASVFESSSDARRLACRISRRVRVAADRRLPGPRATGSRVDCRGGARSFVPASPRTRNMFRARNTAGRHHEGRQSAAIDHVERVRCFSSETSSCEPALRGSGIFV
jgi:hypothetical protein